MEKYFCNYNQSLALKELGFKEKVSNYFEEGKSKLHHDISGWDFNTSFTTCVSQPLKSQVFEWFRDKHNLYHSINPLGYNMCLALIGELGNLKSCNVPEYGNYEEAETACIDKLIELLK